MNLRSRHYRMLIEKSVIVREVVEQLLNVTNEVMSLSFETLRKVRRSYIVTLSDD